MSAWTAMIALALLAAPAAPSHDAHDDLAPTPTGGVAWTVLAATEPMEWTNAEGINRLAPKFTPEVEALDGKPIVIAGYMMPFGDEPKRRFALYASKVDCEFHRSPGPNYYVEIDTATPIAEQPGLMEVRGVMTLVRARQGGVFYRISNATVTATGH
jgi:hypothetical protein